MAGCGTSGSGGGYGSAGVQASPSGAPVLSSSELHGIPEAAKHTLTQTAKIGWRLNDAQIFGKVHAPVSGSGPFDLSRSQGRATIDLPEIKHQEPGTEHAIFTPSRVFLQPKGGSFAVLPKGKHWLSASVAGSEAVSVNFPRFVAQIEGVNPVLLLRELEWGASHVVPLGPGRQIVDHVAAQRYRVSVDLSRALAGAGGPDGPAMSQAIQEQLLNGGTRSFDVLTWVDHQGRVVQMRTAPPGTGLGTELLALSYFGSPVKISSPPAGQVVDITSLTPSGERENNGGGDTDGG